MRLGLLSACANRRPISLPFGVRSQLRSLCKLEPTCFSVNYDVALNVLNYHSQIHHEQKSALPSHKVNRPLSAVACTELVPLYDKELCNSLSR